MTTKLTVEQALKILKEYSCIQIKVVESDFDKEQLRQALLLITSLSDWQNFGICADNTTEAFEALSSYLTALGYKNNLTIDSLPNISEPVYLKFNTQKMAHYLDNYTGEYRGVLVSCQAEDDLIAGTYGHFPLDLFA